MRTTTTRPAGATRHPWLALLTGVVAVNALGGAAAMAAGVLGMSASITDRLPFHSPVFAAFALAVVVGLPMTVAAYLAARGRPRAPEAAMLAGLLLVGWIAVQLLVIWTFSWLQPVLAVAGALVFLAGRRAARSPCRPRPA